MTTQAAGNVSHMAELKTLNYGQLGQTCSDFQRNLIPKQRMGIKLHALCFAYCVGWLTLDTLGQPTGMQWACNRSVIFTSSSEYTLNESEELEFIATPDSTGIIARSKKKWFLRSVETRVVVYTCSWIRFLLSFFSFCLQALQLSKTSPSLLAYLPDDRLRLRVVRRK